MQVGLMQSDSQASTWGQKKAQCVSFRITLLSNSLKRGGWRSLGARGSACCKAALCISSPRLALKRATLCIMRSGEEQEREVCCEVLFAFSTVRYLRAEGWLLVQLTSHAGVSSWLAGALYLLQAEKRGEKYPLLLIWINPSLCLFLIKELAPRHETEEFYCWVVWKLYMVYSWGKANTWCWVSLFPKAKCISPRVRRARPAGTKSFTLALTAKRQQWIMFINQPHSSSGGAAESKRGSSSEMHLPPFRPGNNRHKRSMAFTSRTGFAACAASAEDSGG